MKKNKWSTITKISYISPSEPPKPQVDPYKATENKDSIDAADYLITKWHECWDPINPDSCFLVFASFVTRFFYELMNFDKGDIDYVLKTMRRDYGKMWEEAAFITPGSWDAKYNPKIIRAFTILNKRNQSIRATTAEIWRKAPSLVVPTIDDNIGIRIPGMTQQLLKVCDTIITNENDFLSKTNLNFQIEWRE